MKSLVTITILLSCVIACASYQPPREYDFQTEMIYSKSFDVIWNKTVEWFAKQGTPIKNMDKESGFISTEYSLSAGKYAHYVDCGIAGKSPLGKQVIKNPTGNFNVLIKEQPDGKTSVNINCFFQATSLIIIAGENPVIEKIDCASTGALEREIFEYLGIGGT